MNEEMDFKHELAVDRVFEIARKLAEAACLVLQNRHLTDETYNGIMLYTRVALTEISKNEDEPALTQNGRYWRAATETRNENKNIYSQALAIRIGRLISIRALQQARLIVLTQDTRQP